MCYTSCLSNLILAYRSQLCSQIQNVTWNFYRIIQEKKYHQRDIAKDTKTLHRTSWGLNVHVKIFIKRGRLKSKMLSNLVWIETIVHVGQRSAHNIVSWYCCFKNALCRNVFQVTPQSGNYLEPVLHRDSHRSHVAIPSSLMYWLIGAFERCKEKRSQWISLITINICIRWQQLHVFIQSWLIQKKNIMPSSFHWSKHLCHHSIRKNDGLKFDTMMAFVSTVTRSLDVWKVDNARSLCSLVLTLEWSSENNKGLLSAW